MKTNNFRGETQDGLKNEETLKNVEDIQNEDKNSKSRFSEIKKTSKMNETLK